MTRTIGNGFLHLIPLEATGFESMIPPWIWSYGCEKKSQHRANNSTQQPLISILWNISYLGFGREDIELTFAVDERGLFPSIVLCTLHNYNIFRFVTCQLSSRSLR